MIIRRGIDIRFPSRVPDQLALAKSLMIMQGSVPPRLNKNWHLQHPMPPKATFEQRVQWHLAHVKHCACRPITGKLLQQMKALGIQVPRPTRKVTNAKKRTASIQLSRSRTQ
jgi:hypothetical protein